MSIINLIKKHVGERLYPIGFEFCHKEGKKGARTKKIIDYNITFNNEGEVKDFVYIVSYDFLGQPMREKILQLTIDKATNNGWKKL